MQSLLSVSPLQYLYDLFRGHDPQFGNHWFRRLCTRDPTEMLFIFQA